MTVSPFGIGNPYATLGSGPYQSGPYQGIGSYNPAVTLPQVVQLLQIVPQQLQQIQQLFQVVGYQIQHLTQQLGAQGSLGAITPQSLTSPFQPMLSPSAFLTPPLHVM